jgi:hypothetical protein
MSWSQPVWLLGLLLVPIIWWLHRARGHGVPWSVASLLLWSESAQQGSVGTRRAAADPAWWRRAAIAALLVTALAAPRVQLERRPVTVWVDDGLSMATIESDGASRWQSGLARAQETLAARSLVQTEWRTISGQSLPASPQDLRRLTPVTVLDASREHWLVTDGADPRVRAWAAANGIARIVPVGTVTENVAIVALAARPALDSPGVLDVEVEIVNSGLRAAQRTVALAGAGPAQVPRALQLAPLADARLRWRVSRAAGAIRVVLQPGDALAADDSLTLTAQQLQPLDVQLDASCPSGLRRALAAHDELHLQSGAVPQLRIDCANRPGPQSPGAVPRLLLPAIDDARTVGAAALLWSRDAVTENLAIPLPATLRIGTAREFDSARDQVLLWTDGRPAITRTRVAPYTVSTWIDLEQPALQREPEYPVLVAALLDAAWGRPLLRRFEQVTREPALTRIVPERRIALASVPRAARAGRDDSEPLLWLALLLMMWDLAASLRQFIALRREQVAR